MQYPSAGDYFSPIQDPERVFRTSSLKRAQLVKDPRLGTPLSASGNSAIVFKAIVDGEPWALRFFTRHDASTREQYTALGKYFREHDLTDYVATSEWVDDAIEVNGRLWPMLRMQWVDGPTLDDYVDYLVEENDTAALASLADTWRSLIARLQTARFAHGDLQHGNVLIDTRGKLRLVDFDGSWIVPFAGRTPPSETGHPNYQRPNRPWGEWMDTFPGLLIYTSLVALSKNTSPWRDLYDEDNLLFERTDFDPPHKTPAWNRLTSIADEQLDRLLTQLRQCCAPDWIAEGRLDELLGATPMAPSPPVTPWWEQIEINGRPSDVAASNPLAVPPLRPPVDPARDAGRPIQPAPPPATPPRPAEDWWKSTGPLPGQHSPEPRGGQGKPPNGTNGPKGTSGPKAPSSPIGGGGQGTPPRRRRWWVAVLIAAIVALVVAVAFVLSSTQGTDTSEPTSEPTETYASEPTSEPTAAAPVGEPFGYGDDPGLDALWDSCEAGDGDACNDLYRESEVDSEYESYGDTCGNRFPAGTAPDCPSVLS